MRPNRLIARSYLTRGALLWVLLRVLLSVAFLLAGSEPIGLGPAALAAIVLLSMVLGFVETNRRRERALLGNLGVRPFVLAMFFALPAVAGELVLSLVAATIR